jgi:gliding motility-associated-like protein
MIDYKSEFDSRFRVIRQYLLLAVFSFSLLNSLHSFSQPCQGIFSFSSNITPASCNAADGSVLVQGVTGGTGNYTFSLSNGPGQVPTVPPLNDFLFTNLGAGSYSVTISDGTCDTTITVFVPSAGGINGASVQVTSPACNATNGSISVSPIPAGATVNSFTLSTGPNNTTGNFTGLGSGNYSVIMIDANNCTFTVSGITLSQPAGPVDLDITSSAIVCRGGTGVIVVNNVTGGQGPFKFSLNGAAFQNTSSWNSVLPGTYLLTVRDNNGCTLSRTIVIDEAISEIKDCDAGPDLEVNYGENITLQGVQGSGTQLSWSPGNSLSDSTSITPTAFPNRTTLYTLTVRTPEGCKCTSRVLVKVVPLIDITNTFTPNGDGINDTWGLRFSGFYDKVELFIYNRYGDKIYQDKDYQSDEEWDGTINGSQVPTATYYYVVNFRFNDSDSKYTYTGAVTIIR